MSDMPKIYIFSSTGFCGKTILTLGLALKCKEEGYNVGYFKPVCCETAKIVNGEKVDEDALLMKEVLKLDLPLNIIVPVILSSRFLERTLRQNSDFYQDRVFKAYEKASDGMDLMIMEGPCTTGTGASLGVDMLSIAERYKPHLLMVTRVDNDSDVDRILWRKRCFLRGGINMLGAVINCVPPTIIERVKGVVVPVLNKNGVNVPGVIPESIRLRAPSVKEITEKFACTILAGEDKVDKLVENFLVGAMTPERALTYFRGSKNKGVITGGDRTGIQLSALQTDTSVLILTGNLYPDVRVLARAEEVGVPVLLVPYDTYTTVTKMAAITGRLQPDDKNKIELAKNLVENNVDLNSILQIITK